MLEAGMEPAGLGCAHASHGPTGDDTCSWSTSRAFPALGRATVPNRASHFPSASLKLGLRDHTKNKLN